MSYKKIYKSPCISSMHTLEYVKNNLKHMRNIVEFKAFKDCGHEYYDSFGYIVTVGIMVQGQ